METALVERFGQCIDTFLLVDKDDDWWFEISRIENIHQAVLLSLLVVDHLDALLYSLDSLACLTDGDHSRPA